MTGTGQNVPDRSAVHAVGDQGRQVTDWTTDAQLHIPAAPVLEGPAGSKRVAARVPEAQFQHDVVSWARWWGWLVYFTYDSRGSPPGFPDLTLTRAGRLILAELKSATGELSLDQIRWRSALQAVSGIEYRLWRPADWTSIETDLKPMWEPAPAGGGYCYANRAGIVRVQQRNGDGWGWGAFRPYANGDEDAITAWRGGYLSHEDAITDANTWLNR